MLTSALQHVEAGHDLSMEEMAEAIGIIMDGRASEDQIARLLVALHGKGECVAEVAGAALAMRRHMTPIRTDRPDVIDVVGTGGDATRTFNISTAAAIVTAAAGVPVAKHGSIAATGKTGAADVLVALGVNIHAEVPVVEACLEELGLCFCFAPLLHRAMRHVVPIRKTLGTPTIFNILGPLANPAGAGRQLLGVAGPGLHALMADVLVLLGTRRSLVVHGEDGLDEVTLGGVTHVTEVVEGRQRSFDWSPEDFEFSKVALDDIRVDGPQQSAERIRSVLQGKPGPATAVVLANAAAALWTAGRDLSIKACVGLAAEAIETGTAADLLAKLVAKTNR
jgi:anthranilate phosphoribosyltransferase